MAFSLFAKGQDDLDKRFSEAISSTRYNNLYNRIIWDARPTNEYLVDQTKGTIRYQTGKPGITAVAEIEILGTFNLDDNTFLWSDKNTSIDKQLSDKVGQLRSSLPRKYQPDKFKSDTDFNEKLLALFSYHLKSNGFDIVRQGNTILYFALMKINILENESIKSTIDLEPHFDMVAEDAVIKTIKQYHREMVEINDKHFNKKKMTPDEAFKAIMEVHLKYWLNEDEYHFPVLCWPSDYAERSTRDWQVVELKKENRMFVVYTTDLGHTMQHYAYEIDKNANGNKIIIGQY